MPIKPLNELAEQKLMVTSAPLTSGVINRFFRREIPETAAQELKNIDASDPVVPQRRDGYAPIAIGTSGIDGGYTSKRIGALAWFNPSVGDKFFVISIPSLGSGKLYRTRDVTSLGWEEIVTSEDASVDLGSTDSPWFQANDKLWMLPGPGGRIAVIGDDAIAEVAGDDPADAPAGAVDGVYLLERVFLLVGRKVFWSGSLPTSAVGGFDEDTQSLTMSPNRGASSVAMRSWRDGSLIVWFDLTVEEMVVDPSDPSDSIRNVIESSIGCCSRASVVSLGDDFYFADQWGQIRSLKRSGEGKNMGVVPVPLSEPIKAEIPGRVNKLAMAKIRTVVFDDHMEVYYPRDSSTEANARFTWDFSTKSWYGPDVLADPVGQVTVSNIRERGEERFSTNGESASPAANVFLWDQGAYTDNGDAIEFLETTRSMDLGAPESRKRWMWLELEYYGDSGVAPTVEARRQEDGEDWIELELVSGTNPCEDVSDFPLVPSDFPLVPEDFPLETTTRKTARARYQLDSDVVRPSRCLEVRIGEDSTGLAFQRRALRLLAQVDPWEENPTDDD